MGCSHCGEQGWEVQEGFGDLVAAGVGAGAGAAEDGGQARVAAALHIAREAVAASFDAGRMAQVNTDPVMPAAELMAKA